MEIGILWHHKEIIPIQSNHVLWQLQMLFHIVYQWPLRIPMQKTKAAEELMTPMWKEPCMHELSFLQTALERQPGHVDKPVYATLL